jgi:hypothetical protein
MKNCSLNHNKNGGRFGAEIMLALRARTGCGISLSEVNAEFWQFVPVVDFSIRG